MGQDTKGVKKSDCYRETPHLKIINDNINEAENGRRRCEEPRAFDHANIRKKGEEQLSLCERAAQNFREKGNHAFRQTDFLDLFFMFLNNMSTVNFVSEINELTNI